MIKTILLPAILLITGVFRMPRKEESKKVSTVSGTNTPARLVSDSAETVVPAEIEAFFLVADTGYIYERLRSQMLRAARKISWAVDTLECTWVPGRDSILPIEPSPTFFAGGYYPRMSFDRSFSIEYWDSFSEEDALRDNKMALIAGVYPRQNAADSALKRLLPHCPKAFVQPGMLLTHVIH